MKKTNAKVDAVLYTSKTLADGSHPIMIRIREDGKRRYFSTGCSCKKSQWNKATGTVKSSVYEAVKINNKVGFLISEKWREIFAKLDKESEGNNAPTVGEIFASLMDELKRADKIGNASVYSTAKNMIAQILGQKLDFPIEKIDLDALNKIDAYMRSKCLKETTMHNRMRTIRAVWNYAIKKKYASRDAYPFAEFSLSRYSTKTTKRAISKEQVKAVINYNLPDDCSPWMKLARDMFAFSYLCGGVPFYDLCTLNEKNLTSGSLRYTRKKTHLEVKVAVPARAMEIVNEWKPKSKGYLFPILDASRHLTEQSQRNRIHKVYVKINGALKEIGRALGIESNLTTYVARHSFATVLKREGVPLEIISEALGHQDLSTTKIYLDSFSNDQMLEAQSKLL